MKIKTSLLFLLVILSIKGYTQQKQTLSGFYQSPGYVDTPGSITHLKDDYTYTIVALGTIIHGTWELNDNEIVLTPIKRNRIFNVYGRFNPSMQGCKMMVIHGENNSNFLLNKENNLWHPLFNENANCFDYPYIKTFPSIFSEISLTNENLKFSKIIENTVINNSFNDFIIVNNHSNYESKIFHLFVRNKKIFSSNDEELTKFEPSEEDLDFFEELEKNKTNFLNGTSLIYSNAAYNTNFDEYYLDNYTFNKSKNAYIINSENKQDETNEENVYHNLNEIFLYEKMESKRIPLTTFSKSKTSIFTAKCEEENNDEYN